MIRTGAAMLAALVLAACGSQHAQTAASASPETHESVRLAFRASFLHSCLTGVPGPAGQLYCACADDRIESTFSDAELAAITPQNPRFRAITHECAKKAKLTVRPGY